MAQDKLYVPKYPGQGSPQGVGRAFTQSRGGAAPAGLGYLHSKWGTGNKVAAAGYPGDPTQWGYPQAVDKLTQGKDQTPPVRGWAACFWFRLWANTPTPTSGYWNASNPAFAIWNRSNGSNPKLSFQITAVDGNASQCKFGVQSDDQGASFAGSAFGGGFFGTDGKSPDIGTWYHATVSRGGPNSSNGIYVRIADENGNYWSSGWGSIAASGIYSDGGHNGTRVSFGGGFNYGVRSQPTRCPVDICQFRSMWLDSTNNGGNCASWPVPFENTFWTEGAYLAPFSIENDEAHFKPYDSGLSVWKHRSAWLFDGSLDIESQFNGDTYVLQLNEDGELRSAATGYTDGPKLTGT